MLTPNNYNDKGESMVAEDPTGGTGTIRKVSWRLLPLLFLGYGIAYMDRVNISFARLQMNDDLHFSATVYGLGAGLFFLSYALCEVPSNLFLLRFGARRWLARIMLTWGLLAVGMMFVRTPLQFYVTRFLLGAAEAGFFPGVLFYLTQWFPAAYRGRAVSRFYVALPLSSAVMGALAGPLLGLDGWASLSGWQWLFLVQGTPAIVLGFVILVLLPDTPRQAPWLDERERHWLESELSADAARLQMAAPHGVVATLQDRRVWLLGICNVLILGANYGFSLSAPDLLRSGTQWHVGQIGLLMSGTALLGAAAMVFNGAHSDTHGERYLHTVIPVTVSACGFAAMGLWTAPWVTVATYIVIFIGYQAVQATFWLIPSDSLRGRSAAAGIATIGSIGMVGAFASPYGWGMVKDHTGTYQAALLSLALCFGVAATLLLFMRSKARSVPADMSAAAPVTR
jgi:MFS transporter, ACS family, tartrate transporter